jgi:hypothetical protein
MEAMIRTEFGPLVKPALAPPRSHPLRRCRRSAYKVVTIRSDPILRVAVQKRARNRDRVGDRRSLVNQLVAQMLNDRFDELSRKPDA